MAERHRKSPFPGMDPFLERRWGSVHVLLMSATLRALQPLLPEGLSATVEESVILNADEDEISRRKPDVFVVESSIPWEARGDGAGGAATLDQPILLEIDDDPIIERHIRIIDEDGNRVVTAIEFLSPWNKLDGSGKTRYLRKREQYLASKTHLVEIDLVRAGEWWTMVAPHRVRPEYRTTYRVTVKRAGVSHLELYRIPLQGRLPAIGIPLRAKDDDLRLDMQALVEQVYREGEYGRNDYGRPCDPPLEGTEAEWARERIKAGV